MSEFDLNLFGFFLWLVLTVFLLNLLGAKPNSVSSTSKTSASIFQKDLHQKEQEIEELKQQCYRLREELKQQSYQKEIDFQETVFEQLQTLLTNYPTACQMAQAKPDLPAKNLVALFSPLDNLIQSWGYEPIGQPWRQVNYNPQHHQPDNGDITEGELVYIRFVGYRQGEKILFPAKVSRFLPEQVQ